LTLAPTIALWSARIRPPYFGSVTGRDLFRRDDGLPTDAVAPVEVDGEEEANPDTTPRGREVAAAAKRANQVLTGICVGAAIALPPAVWVTLVPGRRHSVAAAVLAGLFVLIFISRGRAYADKRQAIALVVGAAVAVCAGVVKYLLHSPAASGGALLWAALVLAGFAAAGLIAALLVPVTRFTPLVRMIAEWLELVAIIAALPLAAWVGGLFTWVRMR
jgi:type VII secretion integral membrane protein EccD